MIIISIDGPNVSWKMIEIANEHHQKQDSNAPSLVAFMFFMVPIKQSVISCNLDTFLKNCFSILNKSRARRSAYLKCNDLFV